MADESVRIICHYLYESIWNTMIKPITLLLPIAFLAPVGAKAVKASPEIFEYIQASGDTVAFKLIGDEESHWVESTDGYPLIHNGSSLYFAAQDSLGSITPSPFLACDSEKRQAPVTDFLGELDKGVLTDLFIATRLELSKKRALPRGGNSKEVFGLLPGTTFPSKGFQKALVLLVEFNDVKFKDGYDPLEYFTRLLNEPGFSGNGATGSARDYFISQSDGQFTPEFEVHGPIQLPKEMSYYGGNDKNGNDSHPADMVTDACRIADREIDFREFDRDGDGVVDNVFLFYAGRGEASGGSDDSVWPHSSDIRYFGAEHLCDGKALGHYACTNELTASGIEGIGTFVHEFSHVLGLPDLYSTEYTKVFTPGPFSVMDSGSYSNNGKTPPNYSSFERYALGWISPEILAGPRNVELSDITFNEAVMIPTDNPNDILFLENRQQYGWDAFLPGHGMIAWHVEYNSKRWADNAVNTSRLKQYVDIIEADKILSEQTRSGDTFPGSNNFTALTYDSHKQLLPAFSPLAVIPIVNIREEENKILFSAALGAAETNTPHSLEATNISESSMTLRWAGTNESYLVTVGNDRHPVNDVYATIDGLDAATEYMVRVYGIDNGVYSAPVSLRVRTSGSQGPAGRNPSVSVESLGNTSYQIKWSDFDEADRIFLDIYTKTTGEPVKTINDFTEQSAWEREGWNINPIIPSSTEGCFGQASPSLSFLSIGGRIESPRFVDEITSVEYWCKGIITINNGPIVTTEGLLDSGAWTTISRKAASTHMDGKIISINVSGRGFQAVRLIVECPERSRCYIDDITVSHGHKIVNSSISGFPQLVEPNGEIVFFVPDSQAYFLRISSEKGGAVFYQSPEYAIGNSIGGVQPSDAPESECFRVEPTTGGVAITTNRIASVAILNHIGQKIAASVQEPETERIYPLCPGFYIVSSNGHSKKIIVR